MSPGVFRARNIPGAAGKPKVVQTGETAAKLPIEERYYERVRAAADVWLSRHAGPRYNAFRQVLFLVPDVFTLVFRLARDRRVGLVDRLQLWGLALYILSPVDINLDFILPYGPLDDLALSLVVLDSVLSRTPRSLLQEHWPGDEDVMDVLRGMTRGLTAIYRMRRRRREGGRR